MAPKRNPSVVRKKVMGFAKTLYPSYALPPA
jgi:hypothetical protein